MCFLAEYRRAIDHDSNREVENETLSTETVFLEEEDEDYDQQAGKEGERCHGHSYCGGNVGIISKLPAVFLGIVLGIVEA